MFLYKVVWSLLDKIAKGFQLGNVFPRVLRQFCTGFLLMHCCMEPLGYYCVSFWPAQSCLKSIEITFQRIFSYAMLSGASRTTLHRIFYLCNVVPRVLRQNCTGFLMQCYVEPLGLYCIGFWPAQCCPKTIKTTLHRVFSYTKLSGASWTTLHKVFSCAMSSQEY